MGNRKLRRIVEHRQLCYPFLFQKVDSLPQRNSNSMFATDRSACCPAGYTAATHAGCIALLPTNLTTAILLTYVMAVPITSQELKLQTCILLDTARYVLGCSKYFEQLKTPCPYRKLDFLRSRKSFQISDAIFTLLNGLNYSLSTLLLIL